MRMVSSWNLVGVFLGLDNCSFAYLVKLKRCKHLMFRHHLYWMFAEGELGIEISPPLLNFMEKLQEAGDIGEWQPDGTMKIIDRKKNIFKLSQGEYVAVEVLESAYMQSPLVASVWVYGNSFESFLVSVVVLERQALEEWAAANNKAGGFSELCNDMKAMGYILDELNKTGKKLGLRGFEMLKAAHRESVPFSIEKDLITPTFKLKRPRLLKYYKDLMDQMYKEAKEERTAV